MRGERNGGTKERMRKMFGLRRVLKNFVKRFDGLREVKSCAEGKNNSVVAARGLEHNK
jgi:hypothetical protein